MVLWPAHDVMSFKNFWQKAFTPFALHFIINHRFALYTKGFIKIEVSSYVDIMMINLFRWSVFQSLEALFPIIVIWYINYKVCQNILDLQRALLHVRFTLSKIKVAIRYENLYLWVASKVAIFFRFMITLNKEILKMHQNWMRGNLLATVT